MGSRYTVSKFGVVNPELRPFDEYVEEARARRVLAQKTQWEKEAHSAEEEDPPEPQQEE